MLLKCAEFESNAALRAVFVTDELAPFRERLPEAASKAERVDRCLEFLLPLQLTDGRAVLPLLLKALSARYDPRDAVHGELQTLWVEIVNLNHSENRRPSATPHTPPEPVRSPHAARIFLCYALEDRAKVELLHQDLVQAGFTPWMDVKDLLPGQTWKRAIAKAIRAADCFLACLSNTAVNKRSYLQRELKQALDLWQEKLADDIYLIPVRLENCEIPDSLADFTWVDLFEADGFTRLVNALQIGVQRNL